MLGSADSETLDELEVECTHCGVRMKAHWGSGGRVRYFQCTTCHRWVSSTYSEVLRANAGMRSVPRASDGGEGRFGALKDRLDRWLRALDDQDPYRLLGVSPMDDEERVKARYRELALSAHPDRGGSVETMRGLNLAYERILEHQAQRKREQEPAVPCLGPAQSSPDSAQRTAPAGVRSTTRVHVARPPGTSRATPTPQSARLALLYTGRSRSGGSNRS